MPIPHHVRALILALAAAFVTHASWGLVGDDVLLPEDEAFAFSARLLPDNSIEARWEIADGYYMYRDKMGYDIVGDNGFSGSVELPPGKPKHDEFFGDVEVYTGSLRMVLPLKDAGSGFTLIADGQGCNEPVGVCYPPVRHEITFLPGISNAYADPASGQPSGNVLSELTGSAAGTGSQSEDDPVAELRNLLKPTPANPDSDPAELLPDTRSSAADGSGESSSAGDEDSVAALKNLLETGFPQPEFLPPEEAFKLSVDVVDGNTLEARFDVVEGYYLYRDKISFSGQGDARVGDYALPAGEEKQDEFFGLSRVFKYPFTVPIDLQRTAPGAGSIILEAGYQGCADQGICYPPSTQSVTLALPPMISAAAASETVTPVGGGDDGIRPSGGAGPDTDTRSLLSILAGALLAGLLLTFTPCVLPMIPILSGVIAGQGENLTRRRGGALAMVYVIGTAVTYAAMGWVAGATGEQLQAYFQNVWAIGIMAVIFFLMALSMFGLYEIQMPSAIQSRLQNSTSGMGGSFPMVFLLGLVSALIVGACVSPILISFLGIAVSRADPVLGAQMMFVMSLGMGVPLIALGFGAGYLLPKAGAWMDLVKHFFGILLIAVAIYLLGVLPAVPVLLVWGVFFIILSTYLGATQSLPDGASGWRRLAKGIGTVLLIWGIAAIVGGFYGERDLLKPLPARLFSIGGSTAAPEPETHLFTAVSNTAELDQQFVQARQSGRRIMLDYYADWCVDCVKMEKSTFQDPAVARVLEERYLALQVNVTDPKDPGTRSVKKRFGVFGPPAVLFFDQNGNPLKELSFYGYRNPEDFLALIDF
ncbi:MAG: protein-disulfide reductase DsbD [Gammaproteobacteria bacterium]|nr:protein-disulfide reductase DsbD [Gammaproteobacteria bacterium]